MRIAGALAAGAKISVIGVGFWFAWALVNGNRFDLAGVTAEEVAAGLDVIWKAFLIAGPATTVVMAYKTS